MKTLQYPINSIAGGLNYSVAADLIADNQSPSLQNVRILNGEVTKMPGYELYGAGVPLDGQVMMIDQYYLYDGTSYLLAFTTKSCYFYDTSDSTWKFVHDGESCFTGDAGDPFSGDIVANTYIVCNGIDEVHKITIDPTDGPTIAALGGIGAIASTAKFVKNFLNYCLLFGTTESAVACPQRVRWNDLASGVEVWTGGTSGFIDLAGGSDWVIGAIDLSNRLAVLKERSITVGTYYGGLSPFGWEERVVPDVGAASIKAFTTLSDEIFFLGWDGPYTFDLLKAAGLGQVMRDSFLKTLDPGSIGKAFVFVIEEFTEIWISVLNALGTWEQWIYNYQNDTWTYVTKQITCAGYYEEQAAKIWSALTGNWQDQFWQWSERTLLSASPITLFGDASGNIFKYNATVPDDNAVAINAFFCTKDFCFLDAQGQPIPNNQKRVLMLEFTGYGTSINVQASYDQGSTWTTAKSVTLTEHTAKYAVPFDVRGNFIRFKFSETTATGAFAIKTLRVYYHDLGPR